MQFADICDAFAAVLAYPGEGYPNQVEYCRHALSGTEAAPLLEQFAAVAERMSINELQESFIATFDLNPVCALELGWHLFGENYDRGAFLVKMRQELRRYGVQESSELPDHLSHALLLSGRMEPDRARDFATACVLPALEKMLAAFQDKNNPWENPLQALARTLRSYCGISDDVMLAEPEPALRVLE